MTELKIYLELDGKLGEIAPDVRPDQLKSGQILAIGTLPGGMSSGKPSVGLTIRVEDGSVVFAETSLKNLQMACAAFIGKFGDVTDGETTIRVTAEGLTVDKRQVN